jgi:transcription elongation factor GreB
LSIIPEQEGKVYFGAWVEIENDEGEQKTLRIVGIDEIYDHHPQHISIESPMARALLSKQVDDEVEVITPLGKKCGISIKFAMKNLKIRNF